MHLIVLRKWCLDRLVVDGVKGNYCHALNAEVQ